MPTYSTDFGEYTTGVQPADWTARWVTSGVTWTVESGGDFGGKVLRGERSTNARSLLSWDEIDGDADRATVEVLIRLRIQDKPSSSRIAGCAVRGSGSSGSETAYHQRLSRVASVDNNTLSSYLNGTETVLDEHPAGWEVATWYWIRLQAFGDQIKSRRWSGDFGDEPAGWASEETNSSISAAGWQGVFLFFATTVDSDWFGVGTDGDTAPGPGAPGAPGALLPILLQHGLYVGSPA